ncbi:MAG: diaminopimelate epimerase [Oscillospiraceae bacterium]|nr:diaminopimelate epimerase [Oscillospiraceae bacterium]
MHFVKMYACQHDIALLDGITSSVDESVLAVPYLCDRRLGIGAQTLVVVHPSTVAHARISVYTSNGAAVILCGDSIRCAAKFLYDDGHVSNTAMTIETYHGVKEVLVTPSRSEEAYSVTIDLGQARMTKPPIYNPYLKMNCVSLGERYIFMEEDKLYSEPVESLGQKLSRDPSQDGGIDVGFVSASDLKTLALRLWNRTGNETFSDGTAAAAAAALMIDKRKCQPSVTVRMAGGDITVHQDDEGHLFLTGQVCYAFRGEI